MKDSDSKVPDQKELERELNEYLGKKYGDRIRLVVPMLFPKPQTDDTSKEEKDAREGKDKIRFDLKPEELEAYLNEYVIKQEAAKSGMKYLQEDGLRQVIEGRTSIQELLRVCK